MKTSIDLKSILGNKFNLSPTLYQSVYIKNKNKFMLKDLLERNIKPSDKGQEVGSKNYITESTHYFIRTKALQEESFLLVENKESVIPINPKAFLKCNLTRGDILISKDSNVGESVIIEKDYNNYMLSGGIYKLPISKNKYYIYGFLKSEFFKSQLYTKISKGATIKHGKTVFLDCEIPFPNQKDSNNLIEYFETIVSTIIEKEVVINEKYNNNNKIFEEEIYSNSKYSYSHPCLNDFIKESRLNAGYFSNKFQKHDYFVSEYDKGFEYVTDMGFKISRGQNLQVSCIGKSLYSDEKIDKFYTLILPKNLSVYGTVDKYQYLGNPKKLKTLKRGDLIFGAEGFEKGRSLVVIENLSKTITNIHGITLNCKKGNLEKSIYVKCYLDYLRSIGLIDLYAVGGNGGSLAIKYWHKIKIPKLEDDLKITICNNYYNKNNILSGNEIRSKAQFIEFDNKWNKSVGILQLSHSIYTLKHELNRIIALIRDDEKVIVDYSKLVKSYASK